MEWINVKKKLPTECVHYLCYTDKNTIEILKYEGNIGIVTHWMPLPQPPFDEKPYQHYLNKYFIFPEENQIQWSQDFCVYPANMPYGIKFQLTKFINDKRINLVADGYGNLKERDKYGNGAICAELNDILKYMVE